MNYYSISDWRTCIGHFTLWPSSVELKIKIKVYCKVVSEYIIRIKISLKRFKSCESGFWSMIYTNRISEHQKSFDYKYRLDSKIVTPKRNVTKWNSKIKSRWKCFVIAPSERTRLCVIVDRFIVALEFKLKEFLIETFDLTCKTFFQAFFLDFGSFFEVITDFFFHKKSSVLIVFIFVCLGIEAIVFVSYMPLSAQIVYTHTSFFYM